MSHSEKILDQLNYFKIQEKFSNNVWENRGLIPSDDELCKYLENYFNLCINKLINAVQKSVSKYKLKLIIKQALRGLNKFHYDTEERELICEYFHSLGKIVGVNTAYLLNAWLYGYFLATLLRFQKEKRVIATLKQPCLNCGDTLETYITAYKNDDAKIIFFVVTCNKCQGYNLLNLGGDIGSFRFGNYKFEENLSNEYPTKEQAELRFEQIRNFRNK